MTDELFSIPLSLSPELRYSDYLKQLGVRLREIVPNSEEYGTSFEAGLGDKLATGDTVQAAILKLSEKAAVFTFDQWRMENP